MLTLTSSCFVEVDIDALQLEVGVTMISTGGIYTMLIADNLQGVVNTAGVRRRAGGCVAKPEAFRTGITAAYVAFKSLLLGTAG
jgi:hypothetical protein